MKLPSPFAHLRAYSNLAKCINRYKVPIVKFEKQKLAKERIRYLTEENDIKYNQAVEKLATIEHDIEENLKNMARQIVGMSFIPMDKSQDDEEKIEEKITHMQAEECLTLYKKFTVEQENKKVGDDNKEGLLRSNSLISDRLFMKSGFDFELVERAWKHYGINTQITEADRKKYSVAETAL